MKEWGTLKVVKLRVFSRTCETCSRKIPRGDYAMEEQLGFYMMGSGGFNWYHIGHDPESIARDNLLVQSEEKWF